MLKKLSILLLLLALIYSFSNSVLAKEKENKDKGPLSKITFIHYKKNYIKPDGVGKPTKPDKTVSCYGDFGKGVVWKDLPQSIVINSTNSYGLDGPFIKNAIDESALEWDLATAANLYGGSSLDNNVGFDGSSLDGKNALGFGDYEKDGVIAVTSVWGYFGGPPPTREIVEFDIMFDTDFSWGDGGDDSSKMDLQNIATHEIGHGWGMADVYDSYCDQVTMYGYSTEGETIKRDLAPADITGITKLYN